LPGCSLVFVVLPGVAVCTVYAALVFQLRFERVCVCVCVREKEREREREKGVRATTGSV
jgi:uncharacterized protein (DUF2062 family)